MEKTQNAIISRHEAQALVFWASVGFSNSLGGSLEDIPKIAFDVGKRFGFSVPKKDFQKGSKAVFWFTPKVASALWERAVGRDAKIPQETLRQLYRIRKNYLKKP